MLPLSREHSESIFFCIRAALDIRGDLGNAASTLARSYGLPGHVLDPSLLHITLCEIGRAKRQREPLRTAVKRAGDSVRLPQFELILDHTLGFKQGNRGFPNVLLPDASSARMLCLLHDALRTAQLFNGLTATKSYTPHLTLTRSSEYWPHGGPISPVRWLVEEFELVHSYHDGRRRHEVLARFPLMKSI